MKKKLLLMLLLTVAATATMSALAQEQTAAPEVVINPNLYEHHGFSFIYDNCNEYYIDRYNEVTFENNDEAEATIYYRIVNYSDIWSEYNGEPLFGYISRVEAYAVAEGKLPSEIVSANLFYDVFLEHITCVVDGIHYYIRVDDMWNWGYFSSEASVCSRKESGLYSPRYPEDIVIPSELVCDLPNSYVVTEIQEAAFASTSDYSCDIVSVELPNTIVQIWPSAFAGCTHLKRMTIHALTPPDANKLFKYDSSDEDYNYFNQIGYDGNQLYEQVSLFVPNDALEDYRNHAEWGKFTRIVPFIGAGPGDLNGDGKLSINDVTELIDLLLNGEDLPAYCDVNGDGNITINDITALINMVLNAN